YVLVFTISPSVAPAAARAALMFSPTWRIWARMSPLPTTLPARSRASCPATNTRRRPSTATTWEYRVWPLRTGAASASGWMFLRVTVMVVSFLCRLAPSGGAAGDPTADRQGLTHALVESPVGAVGGPAAAVA